MLSFPKILLTAAVIAAVWFVGRWLNRRADGLVGKGKQKQAQSGPVELAKCTNCETYVGPDSAPCEREDCPQRT